MNDPRLVIFDVDGTLVDSQDHICAAMAHAFAAVGHVLPPRDHILSIVGLSLPVAVAQLVPGLDTRLHAAIVAGYKDGFGRLRAETPAPLFPGALAALDRLASRPGIVLGVATGKSRRGLDHILAEHGLAGRFLTRQVADDHPSKPHPSMIRAALAETGIAAGHAVMVGDTTYDIEMGRSAGVATLGVGWGYHPADALRDAGADRVVDRFDDLVPALEEAWAA